MAYCYRAPLGMKEMSSAQYNTMIDRSLSEDAWLGQVLQTAKIHNWRSAHFRPGRTANGWKTAVQGDGVGFPDLLLVRAGALLVVELKRESGKLRAEQIPWLMDFDACGIETAVWRPSDRALAWQRLGPLSDRLDHIPTNWRAWELLHGHAHSV